MARTVEKISPLARIQIEENAGDHNDLFLKTGLEEVETVADFRGKTFEIEPEVKGAVRDRFDVEAHGAETRDDVVAFILFSPCSKIVGE